MNPSKPDRIRPGKLDLRARDVLRFWSNVDKCGPVPTHMPHLGACWLWKGKPDPRGYGAFVHRGLWGFVHRISWRLATGEDPGTMCVLHHCDNPICVNPGHLFLGTRLDNVVDKVNKGRQAKGPEHAERTRLNAARGDRNGARTKPESRARGEKHWAARLNAGQVLVIRSRHAEGESLVSRSREFGVTQSAINLVVRRHTWRHV